LTSLFYDTEQWYTAWPHRDYLPNPISIDIPTTRLTYVTSSLPLHRKRKQRCMRFAKSWDCLENLPASIGGEVARYCLEGKIKEVADYCETDIVNTYAIRSVPWATN
jgi:hypothetical protein